MDFIQKVGWQLSAKLLARQPFVIKLHRRQSYLNANQVKIRRSCVVISEDILIVQHKHFVLFPLRSDGTSIYISSPETVVCLFRPMKIMDSVFVYITTRQL